MMTMDLSRIIPPPAGALTADRTFTLSAGELFERIPIGPGAKTDARLSLPESIRRAAPADPEVVRFAEMAAHEAANELGLVGTIGLQWFTAEQSTRPTFMLGEGDRVAAHLRLDGFATAFQTDPPSLWLRLDGRRTTLAALTRLIRHEVAHVYLEIRGLPSGPIHEAMADTFADGGMPALAGAFGLADSPPVLALNPGNASSTVIIDGTSDMFKIAATGTIALDLAAGDVNGAAAVNLTGLGTMSTTPGLLSSETVNVTDQQSNRYVGQSRFYSGVFVAAASGGSPTTEVVGVVTALNSSIALSGASSGSPVVTLWGNNPSGNHYADAGMRYWVLVEAAI